MDPIVSISNLSKTYDNGHQALKHVDLDIESGEILALLGPNGAGKTTLISIICGIVNATTGSVTVDGHDIVKDYRLTRSMIGLVPQELTLGAFDTVWNTLCFSRGLFGKKPDPALLEKLLKDLSLWDKRDSELMSLSGGMKRKDMWNLVRRLRESGVTIILTTHYIEEAEEIADRVGIVNHGELLLVDDKQALMHKLGKRQLMIELGQAVTALPDALAPWSVDLSDDGSTIVYTYDPHNPQTGINGLLQAVSESELFLKDVVSTQSSLEEIFVSLVKGE